MHTPAREVEEEEGLSSENQEMAPLELDLLPLYVVSFLILLAMMMLKTLTGTIITLHPLLSFRYSK